MCFSIVHGNIFFNFLPFRAYFFFFFACYFLLFIYYFSFLRIYRIEYVNTIKFANIF
jgi:hypothetical protein